VSGQLNCSSEPAVSQEEL